MEWIAIEPYPLKLREKNQRIVQTTQGEKTKQPDPHAYLGQQNQTFDTQTVSKNRISSMGSAGSTSQRPLQNNTYDTATHDLGRFGLQKFYPPTQKPLDEPNWASPGTSPQDFVEGVKESDRTALNTREYAFFGYFQRIRERLDRAWVPLLRKKLLTYYRNGRRLSSDMNHTTRILVILNDHGEVTRLEILSESGNQALDDAAVGAFNQAGPFPNPPKGMIDLNREIKIPWDFVLKS